MTATLDIDAFHKVSQSICSHDYTCRWLTERYFLVSIVEYDFLFDEQEGIWDSFIFSGACNVEDDRLIGELVEDLDLIMDEDIINNS